MVLYEVTSGCGCRFYTRRLPKKLRRFYERPGKVFRGFDGSWIELNGDMIHIKKVNMPSEPTLKEEAKKRLMKDAEDLLSANCKYWGREDKAFKEAYIRHHKKIFGMDHVMTKMLSPAPEDKRVREDNKNRGGLIVGKQAEKALDAAIKTQGKRKAPAANEPANKLAKGATPSCSSAASSSSEASSSSPSVIDLTDD